MTLLLWFSLSVSGISDEGKSLYDGMCSENYLVNLEDFHSIEKPKVTDLQMESLLLDATLVAAFAPLAAMFFFSRRVVRCRPRARLCPAWARCHLVSFWETTAFAWAVVLGMKFHSPFILGENRHDVNSFWNRVLDGVCTVLSEVNLERLRFNRRGASTQLWGVGILHSPKQAAQPNPSCPALCRQDTTSPWSTYNGGNIYS